MHAWEAIQKTLDYIEENISENIKIEDLAEIAVLSQFYYQRLFARLVKKPVREYIKLRRLARTSVPLADSKNRISDVAIDFGFGSHEVFTRAFKNIYKITPDEYRHQAVKLDNFDKPDLLLNYRMVDEGVPLISEGIILEYNRKTLDKPMNFTGVKGFYTFTKGKMFGERPGVSEPAAIWDHFFSVRQNINALPNPYLIGVSYHGDAPEGYSSYFVGIESQYDASNVFLMNWELPAREYLVCSFEAKNKEELTTIALGKAIKDRKVDYLSEDTNGSVVILIANKLSMFPISFYQSNPEVTTITLQKPDRLEREEMLAKIETAFDVKLKPGETLLTSEKKSEYIDMLDDFTNRKIIQL